jgi:membrane-associated phospholipid phosphatase
VARNALVLVNVVALAVFWTYPVAPPRLLPDGGFTDIVAASGTWGAWDRGGAIADRANELGSMPSLHLAWAAWVALVLWRLTTRTWVRALGCVHVALTSVVVVLTGNHYLVDLPAGVALALGCWLAAARFALPGHTATSQPLVRQPAP